jgi:gliding motility-associated-like protein
MNFEIVKTEIEKIWSLTRIMLIAACLIVFSNQSNAKASAKALAIQLQLTKISNGIARLDWTFQTGTYELIRTDPSGSSDTIYRGTNLNYTDTISAPPMGHCDSTNFTYIVEISGLGGSASNAVTDIFWDDTKPRDVVMDTIYIDQNGHPVISWNPSTSGDVFGYSIQEEFAGGIWHEIGFAPGILTTSFTADTIDASKGIKTFAVIAQDQCGNSSNGVIPYSNPLRTLFLQIISVDKCREKVTLSWNEYKDLYHPVGGYQIYRKEDVGAFTLIGTTGQNETTYSDQAGFIPGFDYSYFVRAYSQDGQKSSSSNQSGFTFDLPPDPDTVSLNFVSVSNSQFVEMNIHFGPTETVKSLRIYRADEPSSTYTLIDSITTIGILPDIPFYDMTALVNNQSYYYQIRALNSCKTEVKFSDLSRTIFLSCVANTDQSNDLSWNEYSGWLVIDHYEINRLVNGIPDPLNPIATIPSGNLFYTDVPPASQQNGDILSYYITAFEGNIVDPDSSVSNIVKALRQPLVVMPNAFVPRGTNNIFRPVMEFVDDGNYQLLIYNKWGLQVFISTNKDIGWNGKYNGQYAPSGIYFYRLQYSSFTGDSFSKMGSLMLVE